MWIKFAANIIMQYLTFDSYLYTNWSNVSDRCPLIVHQIIETHRHSFNLTDQHFVHFAGD